MITHKDAYVEQVKFHMQPKEIENLKKAK